MIKHSSLAELKKNIAIAIPPESIFIENVDTILKIYSTVEKTEFLIDIKSKDIADKDNQLFIHFIYTFAPKVHTISIEF